MMMRFRHHFLVKDLILSLLWNKDKIKIQLFFCFFKKFSPSLKIDRGRNSVLILAIGINGKLKMASLDKSRDAIGEVGNDSGLTCTGSIELRLCENNVRNNVKSKKISAETRKVTN